MKNLFLTCLILNILSGCSKKIPTCMDLEATNVIKQMILAELEKKEWNLKKDILIYSFQGTYEFKYDFQINNVRVTSHNSETGASKCVLKAVVEYTNINPNTGKLQQKKVANDVTYTIEKTAYSDEAFVSGYDLDWM